ncbi:TetR/AcrR family transcriptional regulator [Streptomyces sp. NPDC088785]|uniref:TetR/AcrR family transcriptional regulator n=1 Tax=Streptomyces sp. NPDC088785 TaxID=3365897 RepID=UPI00380F87F9
MARWKPDAPQRLVTAALELFEERGYEQATVPEIAERAGLTRSTFFRHFDDKREVLFGGDAMADRLAAAIDEAPATAAPFEAVARGLEAAGRDFFTPDRREFAVRRSAVIDASPELREREALKGIGLAAAMARALTRRGLAALEARVIAELGALALKIAYERWSRETCDDEFGAVARRALDEVRAVDDRHRPERQG